MRQPRNLNLGHNVTAPEVHDKNQLSLFMKFLEKFQICRGVSTENYLDQLPYDLQNVAFLFTLKHVAQVAPRQIIT